MKRPIFVFNGEWVRGFIRFIFGPPHPELLSDGGLEPGLHLALVNWKKDTTVTVDQIKRDGILHTTYQGMADIERRVSGRIVIKMTGQKVQGGFYS